MPISPEYAPSGIPEIAVYTWPHITDYDNGQYGIIWRTANLHHLMAGNTLEMHGDLKLITPSGESINVTHWSIKVGTQRAPSEETDYADPHHYQGADYIDLRYYPNGSYDHKSHPYPGVRLAFAIVDYEKHTLTSYKPVAAIPETPHLLLETDQWAQIILATHKYLTDHPEVLTSPR